MEYEMQVCIASIDRFCPHTDKSQYNPGRIDETNYYEILIPLFTSTFKVSAEVKGIDAILYSIEKL